MYKYFFCKLLNLLSTPKNSSENKKNNVKIKEKEKEDTYKTQIINQQTMPRTQP